MKRLAFDVLKKWQANDKRKPLLIRGARQVGKTWIVRELGKQFKNFIEVNFELYPDVRKIFQRDLDPARITRDLSLFFGKSIKAGESLLFFDEIQEEPKAIRSLRYFYEMLPEQHIIAAGSLLDFQLENIGLPVGRVSMIYLYPLSFLEFLAAKQEELLIETITTHEGAAPLSEPVHQKLLHLAGEYMAVGGMPEVVTRWIETSDFQECTAIHRAIVDTYRQDFSKYAQKFQVKYVSLLFDFIPSKMGQQFKFAQVPGEYRKRDLAPALELLIKAGVVHKIVHSSGRGIPLGAQANPEIFKLIFLDIALAQTLLGVETTSWILEPGANFINKGEMTEAFVGQEILAYQSIDQKAQLYYWNRAAKTSSAEVDYLIQRNQHIIPVEVKSGSPGTLKRLRLFLEQHKTSEYGIRISALNYAQDKSLNSFPLYAVAKVIGYRESLY